MYPTDAQEQNDLAQWEKGCRRRRSTCLREEGGERSFIEGVNFPNRTKPTVYILPIFINL